MLGRRGGLTSQIAAFACSVTQFLESRGMGVLGRVCRQDRCTTLKIWRTSKGLIDNKVSLSAILRGENSVDNATVPLARSYAYSRAISAIGRFFDKRGQSVSFGIDLPSLDGEPSFCEIGLAGSGSICTSGCNQGSLPSYFLLPLTDIRRTTPSSIVLDSGRNTKDKLLDMLVERGLDMTYACVGSPQSAEMVIELWFRLDVAPTLRLECGSWMHGAIKSSVQYQCFKDHIQFVRASWSDFDE
jgi:hypothetical protein